MNERSWEIRRKKDVSNEKWVGIDQRSMSFHRIVTVIDFIYSDFGRYSLFIHFNFWMHDNDTVCKLCITLCLDRKRKWKNEREKSTRDDVSNGNFKVKNGIFYSWWWRWCCAMEGTFCHELSRFNNFYLSTLVIYLPTNLPMYQYFDHHWLLGRIAYIHIKKMNLQKKRVRYFDIAH